MENRETLKQLVNKGILTREDVAYIRCTDYIKENDKQLGRNDIPRIAYIIGNDWNLTKEQIDQLTSYCITIYLNL